MYRKQCATWFSVSLSTSTDLLYIIFMLYIRQHHFLSHQVDAYHCYWIQSRIWLLKGNGVPGGGDM